MQEGKLPGRGNFRCSRPSKDPHCSADAANSGALLLGVSCVRWRLERLHCRYDQLLISAFLSCPEEPKWQMFAGFLGLTILGD
jgi:hypothetical protein